MNATIFTRHPIPKTPRAGRAIAALLLFAFLPAWAAADNTIRVAGTHGPAHTWTAAQLKQLLASDVKIISYVSRGQKHTAEAVPLLAALKAAGVPTALSMDPKADPRVKNYVLRLVVVIRAGDGYAATLSLAELLPAVGGREAWLALDEDGKPLSFWDGAAKLIVPGDKNHGRWVHDIADISVINPLAPTTQPGGR